MLSVMTLLNNNGVAEAQEYDKYGDSHYSQYPTEERNMNVEHAHSKASL